MFWRSFFCIGERKPVEMLLDLFIILFVAKTRFDIFTGEDLHMITVKEYRGHIRNWEELCERLELPLDLSREEREEKILIKAYETWGYEMADHMHGMFAFALWDDEERKLFCLRDHFGTKPFYYYETEDGKLLYESRLFHDPADRSAVEKIPVRSLIIIKRLSAELIS